MNLLTLILLFVNIVLFDSVVSQKSKKGNLIEEVSDAKELKKILRTKTNVLVCFTNNPKQGTGILKLLTEAAEIVKGQGTILQVDCTGEGKKMCKKLKIGIDDKGDSYVLRHYKDGEFHKIYDRKETVASIVGFMRDPTGDLPWDEDESAQEIVHLSDPQSFIKFIRREKLPIMVMFYAPWCGFCKQLKPEYIAAASMLKGIAIMAAIDVNRPENAVLRVNFNITGFPTLLYFENGEYKYTYEGENKRDKLVAYMKDPTAEPPPKPKDEDWSMTISDVVHLTVDTFDTFIQEEESVLVMFYAPWCGHCKKLKPEYEKAAAQLNVQDINGKLAALDVTKEMSVAKRFAVKSYPTLKYFSKGEFRWDTPSLRDAAKLVEYMTDPKEPPAPPPPEPHWSEVPSEVVHLNDENFKTVLKKKRHALVMFYAPWCGHCKAAKPEFIEAADELKEDPRLTLAALDCTKHSSICSAVGVSGYPTFKYYNYYNKGKDSAYDKGRKKEDFVKFLRSKVPTATETVSPSRVADEAIDAAGKAKPDSPKVVVPDTLKSDSPKLDTKAILDWGSGAKYVNNLTQATYEKSLKGINYGLVFFYHPKCEKCQKEAPQFSAAAKHFSSDNRVKFFAVDFKAEKDLIKSLGIPAHPHFMFYNKYNLNKIVEFSGFKMTDELVTFVNTVLDEAAAKKSKDEL